MIIDGRGIAKAILEEMRQRTSMLSHVPVVRAITVSPNLATKSYLNIKSRRAKDAGMVLDVVELRETSTTEECIDAVQKEGADAVIVQLPLPSHLNTEAVVNSIPLEKDADVLSAQAYEKFEKDMPGALLPPVVGAIKEILDRHNVVLFERKVLVIGEGKLVGRPVATWLRKNGVAVETVNKESFSIQSLKEYEVIISGVGQPHFIMPDMIREGVILIDAGTSESNGSIQGDAHPSCGQKTSLFTPVPGGVGPVAVACLFKNVSTLTSNICE